MQMIVDTGGDQKLAFHVGTTMRNGLCMMFCDTAGGELFTYIQWDSMQRAVEIEAYSQHPIVVAVALGKEIKALILSRPQFVFVYGLSFQGQKSVEGRLSIG